MNANTKKITGSLLLFIGVALIIFGSIISGKVDEGQKKVHRAQKTVNTVRQATRISPYTKDVGRIATRPAQHKINKGRKKVKKFRGVSIVLLIVGIVSSAAGALFLYMGFISKKR